MYLVQARYNDPNLWLFCGIRKSKAPEGRSSTAIQIVLHELDKLFIAPFTKFSSSSTKAWISGFECVACATVTAPYTKEATSEFSDPSFQDSTGSSAISRWVARYYAPLFESNLFKIIVVWLRCIELNSHIKVTLSPVVTLLIVDQSLAQSVSCQFG